MLVLVVVVLMVVVVVSSVTVSLSQFVQNSARVIRTRTLLPNVGCRRWVARRRRKLVEIDVSAKTMMMQSAMYRYVYSLSVVFVVNKMAVDLGKVCQPSVSGVYRTEMKQILEIC